MTNPEKARPIEDESKNPKDKLARLLAFMILKRVFSGESNGHPELEHLTTEDLNAPTAEEGHQKFLKVAREVLSQSLATHGKQREGKTQKIADLDARISFGLLRLAGCKFDEHKDVVYVESGQMVEGRIQVDTGNVLGTQISEDWHDLTDVLADHHLPDAPLDSSSAKIVYENLVIMGLLERTEALDRLVEFVSQADNKKFDDIFYTEEWQRNISWRSIAGVGQNMDFKKLHQYFERYQSPYQAFPKDPQNEIPVDPIFLREFGLVQGRGQESINLCQKRKNNINQGLDMVRELRSKGFEIKTRYGKFFVDYISEGMSEQRRKGVPLRADAVLANGYQGLIIYNQETESYFINLDPRIEARLNLSNLDDGVAVRGKMFIRNFADKTPLKHSLADIFSCLGGNPVLAKGELGQAIKENEEWIKLIDVDGEIFEKYQGGQGQPAYWGLPSRQEKGRKHGRVVLPENFQPEKGRKYQVRIIGEKNDVAFLKVFKAEFFIVSVRIDIDSGKWKAVLPGGEELELPSGEYDARQQYEISYGLYGEVIIKEHRD